jgi:hypothetical protein
MMARSSKAPRIGRIQMRKTNFPNHHFRLATRGRSIQMGHKATCWPIYVSWSSSAFAALRSAVSKPSSKPAEGWSKQRAGVTAPPLIAPQVRKAQSRAKLERLGTLRAGYCYSPSKTGFDLRGRCALHPHKFSLDAGEFPLPHVSSCAAARRASIDVQSSTSKS